MKHLLLLLIVGLLTSILAIPSYAQTTINCGDVINGEFTESSQYLTYQISLEPTDILRVNGTSVGDYLTYMIGLYAPSGTAVGGYPHTNDYNWGIDGIAPASPSAESGVLGEHGLYTIGIRNTQPTGIYTLRIGCTIGKTGQVIEPGETLTNTSTPTPDAGNAATTNLIPSIAYLQVNQLAIPAGVPMSGAINPTGDEVLGLGITGNAGDRVSLIFTRLSGSLNLGVFVVSSDNQTLFFAALGTNDHLSTEFVLPNSGSYAVGVKRIDLLPVSTPDTTVFQLQATVNTK